MFPLDSLVFDLLFPATAWTTSLAHGASYSLARGHRVYAAGHARVRKGHSVRLALHASRRLRAGAYTLSLIGMSSAGKRVVLQESIRVG